MNWVAGIARHRSIDMIRHRQVRAEGHSESWEDLPLFDPPDAQNIEQDFEHENQKQRIRLALYSLPKEQRDSLALVYFRGCTHEEAANILGEPLGTVKTRIRLGMQKLKNILETERYSP